MADKSSSHEVSSTSSTSLSVVQSSIPLLDFGKLLFQHVKRVGKRMDIVRDKIVVYSERSNSGVLIFCENCYEDRDVEVVSTLVSTNGMLAFRRGASVGGGAISGVSGGTSLSVSPEGEEVVVARDLLRPRSARCVEIGELVVVGAPYTLRTSYEARVVKAGEQGRSRPGNEGSVSAAGTTTGTTGTSNAREPLFGEELFRPFGIDGDVRFL